MTDDISRRDFVKQTVVGTMAMASVSSGVMAMLRALSILLSLSVFSVMMASKSW